MKYSVLGLLLSLATVAWAEDLASASRWDISIDSYRYGLKGELVRTLNEYRDSVNASEITLTQDRQIRAEINRLNLLLKSRGYYEATIEAGWQSRSDQVGKPSYRVILGPRYEIAELTLQGNFQPLDDDWLRLEVGDALNASAVISQQSTLKSYIATQDCYFTSTVSHEVQLDPENHSGNLTLIANVKDPAQFNAVSFTGAGTLNQEFLSRTADIDAGDCYKASAISTAVIALLDTGVFSQVKPTVSKTADNQVDVVFALTQKDKRTLSAALGYESEQGPTTTLGWQHRDLFHSAQSLELELSLQETNQTASVAFVVPSFFDRRNEFTWQNEFERDTSDYEYNTFSSTATIEREASRQDYYEYGIGYTQENEYVDDEWDVYHQISVPLEYQYDNVTDPFNPSTGLRWSVNVEPVWDVDDEFTSYLLSGTGVQGFIELNPRLTLASSVKWNSLWYGDVFDSSQENIPESEWLTAGGSSTIRGYAYESIELEEKYLADDDTAGDIAGASQRWLLNNEIRLRLTESWGLVFFLDSGSVSEQINPFDQDIWYSGAGVGVRFFTSFAPIRFDVATPLDQRDEDDDFIIYVSLGQAF
ncbi:autotransporter assembly complex protein TamA [Reinekea thalattae]|uniref:BamA/TamA family outer membrane protein n=1 Tax=Reinekea thalattae TaxID=2593301 RepID=A0A5C8Z8J2_9GAMM|nr:BamA/TamA family outer membrane protein [Reinekea thalattae]TXR54445.1 BamA/TamA family outer membrane protein [Reinekea thalattae]